MKLRYVLIAGTLGLLTYASSCCDMNSNREGNSVHLQTEANQSLSTKLLIERIATKAYKAAEKYRAALQDSPTDSSIPSDLLLHMVGLEHIADGLLERLETDPDSANPDTAAAENANLALQVLKNLYGMTDLPPEWAIRMQGDLQRRFPFLPTDNTLYSWIVTDSLGQQ